MDELQAAASPILTAGVRDGAALGAETAATQHGLLTGPGGPLPELAAGVSGAPAAFEVQNIIAARISGDAARTRVPLSNRLYDRLTEVRESGGQVVASSIRAREGIFETAERFIAENRDAMRVPVPSYVSDLQSAARLAIDTGDRSVLEDAIGAHQRQLDRLGRLSDRRDGVATLRQSARQFVYDLRRTQPHQLERILARHIEDRAQFMAQRIARHETAEAHRAAYLAGVQPRPYVAAVRWTLSSAHPFPDVCDLFANQDLHGLGPGGYPKDAVPETPHPNCLCLTQAIVDPNAFERELAAARGQPEPPRPWESGTTQSAEEWLAQQPERFQRQLLGPTRAAIFADPRDRRSVIDSQGRPIPVGAIRPR